MRTPVLDVFRPFLWLLGRLLWRVRFEGVEHIPPGGPLVIAPNHLTYADPVLVCLPIRFPVHFMAWDALFEIPGLAWLIRRLRAFPVQLKTADTRSTREAVRLLRSGAAVMIFPEAGRSPDGSLQRFRPGAFRLACALKIPVLPVTILGGHEAWPPGRILPRPGRLTIIYHPVVEPAATADARAAAQALSRRVRAAILAPLPPGRRESAVDPQ